MKIQLIKFISLLSVLFIINPYCSAAEKERKAKDPWEQVGQFVQSNLERQFQTEKAATLANNGQANNLYSSFSNQDWNLSAVFLRMQASFGIDVPWLTQLLIVPEMELVFQRPPPKTR